MVYFSFIFSNVSSLNSNSLNLYKDAGIEPFHVPWLSSANDKWGDKFLGAYVLDEPGGKQIDFGHYSGFKTTYSGRNQTTFANVTSYSDAANRFVRGLKATTTQRLNNATVRNSIPNATGRVIPVFTADNALYWFDYLGGYNTLLAQFGWNESVTQQISLVRGAATLQNKDWGTIITWKYKQQPYLDTGEEIYNQMVTAYNAGAKYITVFDFPYNSTGNPYGILTNDHFQALEKFWTQIVTKQTPNSVHAEAALVLPKNYGWGMRNIDDKIWGFWGPDEKSPIIWNISQMLLNKYGTRMDIVYDDAAFPIQGNYSKVYFWNQTILK
jgi:hypothetical protein